MYRPVSRIGTGGMGVVYLAEDPTGNQVALKLIRPELADDPAFRSRFRREVQSGQRVGGICTARYIDADLESDQPYLVTEYVAGGNMADYVAVNGPLSGEQLIGLAVGLAEAVVAIHASRASSTGISSPQTSSWRLLDRRWSTSESLTLLTAPPSRKRA
jgi:serine/threonine protein kinase